MSRARLGPLLVVGLAALALGVAATTCEPRGPTQLHRSPVAELRHRGLSGLGTAADGRAWAVAEERRELLAFDRGWQAAPRVVPLEGVPADAELESLAWLDGSLVALGTEREELRDADDVLVVRIDGSAARVVARSAVRWSELFDARAPTNRGIEGLCAAGGWILAGAEWVLERQEKRDAPLALARHQGAAIGPWSARAVRLSTTTGKVSSLDCVESVEGGLVVHAVERHYGVARVLRFVVSPDGDDAPIDPEIVHDLALLDADLPNLEGLAFQGERLLLVSDHDTDDLEGTTEVLEVDQAPFAISGIWSVTAAF
jgi:hypothetical protein